MNDVIAKLLAPGKGILAADESTNTISKRFAAIGLTSTPELNRKYRQMLFTTQGIEKYISGIIFYKETADQKMDDGTLIPDYLKSLGVVLGLKVDEGLERYKDTDQQITKEVSTLRQTLEKYKVLGFEFAKWRGTITISDLYPTDAFLNDNLGRMVNYAKICQEVGMVPIVEPEVLMDGNHTTTRCEETTTKTLKVLFAKLIEAGVDIAQVIVKTNMVLPGKASGVVAEPLEVANATLRALRNSVPKEVPGIVFLSGGQDAWDAMDHLDKIEDLAGADPWKITFSYSRALQDESRKVWVGKDENVEAAQAVFLSKLEEVSLARQGKL